MCGGRRNVIATPRLRLPPAMQGFKTEDKVLSFRLKTMFAENRNYIARAQSNKRVSSNFWFCIHVENIFELIWFDLKFGYLYFGGILFVNKMVGVIQGSLISLGIADMVLSVIE